MRVMLSSNWRSKMKKYKTITYTGGSGNNYDFTGYPSDTNFKALGAVYIITNRYQNIDGGYSHDKIFIGETGDLCGRFASHHKLSYFQNHNPNSICIFREDDEQRRLQIESDLLVNYSPPCND